ncbi:hypothetical protein OG592_39765 [Streptomyces avidinii]|uniref:hypothetical protein n=1 Tax=Streptomyces avidinii TaxID=1895 RepID=UPI00386EC1EC|nr:hypothetical protein OG592_39765 [Streptomyces avidinii]
MTGAGELVFDHEQVRRNGLEPYEGTPFDVRAVIASIPQAVKDGFRLDEVPWSRFGHAYGPADDVPERLARLRSPDVTAVVNALGQLWGSLVHQGTVGSAAPLAVPFLLRVAADPTAHHRAETLGLATAAARRAHWGYGTRGTFLQVATQDRLHDCSGYAMNWSIEASRNALTADVDLLLPLLHDPDPEVRAAACYALATATGEADRIADALRARLAVEETPGGRASLVLAVAELAREHADLRAAAWARSLWLDPAQPADVRVAAALAWLCLVDDPVPDDLRGVLDALVATADPAGDLDGGRWIAHVDDAQGLARTLDQMLNDAPPGVTDQDPWG